MFVVMGFLQDPLRKMYPGQPSLMVTMCAVVFVGVVLGLIYRRTRFNIRQIPGWRRGLSFSIYVLMAYITVQVLVSFIKYNSVVLAGLGVVSYVMPIFALMTGYFYVKQGGPKAIDQIALVYCILTLIFASGIYMEYAGVSSGTLGEVGVGITIYGQGTVLESHSGLFRASEIAAWHIVAASSLFIMLAVRSKKNWIRVLYVAAILFLLAAGILTGRRKLFVSIFIFISCYWMLTIYFKESVLRLALLILFLSGSGTLIFNQVGVFSEDSRGEYNLYVERASGVIYDITGRAQAFGYGAVVSAIKKYGLWGNGAGTASQGAQYSGGGVRGSFEVEGGFGRVVFEIGAVGLLLVFWVGVAFILYVWRLLKYLSVLRDNFITITYAMIALLIANLAHFLVASQAFSDPFILILLGFFVGVVAGSPLLALNSNVATRPIIQSSKPYPVN